MEDIVIIIGVSLVAYMLYIDQKKKEVIIEPTPEPKIAKLMELRRIGRTV